jgi:hypothetical protein
MEPSQKVADDKEQSPSYPQPPPDLPILTGKVLYVVAHALAFRPIMGKTIPSNHALNLTSAIL